MVVISDKYNLTHFKVRVQFTLGAGDRVNLNFLVHPYSIWGGFFDYLIHAKQALINIELKDQLRILQHKLVDW